MPGELTRRARRFLDERFARDAAGAYQPHQPIHGLGGPGEPGQLLRLARTWRLLRWLDALRPTSLLDLGAAEGYLANLARLRHGCPALCVDLSEQACRRAAEHYGLGALAGSLTALPLRDRCADVVLLSEVFEHLEQPLAALSEALRVCRRYLVLSTQELCASRLEQWLRLLVRDLAEEHTELNQLCRVDLHGLLTVPLRLAPQFRRSLRRTCAQLPRERWRSHLKWLASPPGFGRAEGVIAVIAVDGSPVPPLPTDTDDELWTTLIDGPPAAPAAPPPWDWLQGIEPPAPGQTVVQYDTPPAAKSELHPALSPQAARRLAKRLALPAQPAPPWQRRLAGAALRMMERVGHLTNADPWAVRLRWLLRRSLAD